MRSDKGIGMLSDGWTPTAVASSLLGALMVTIGPALHAPTVRCARDTSSTVSHNVVIDGGLCDVDSIEPIASLPDARDLAGALSTSLTVLAQTVSGATSLPCPFTAAYLWQEIVKRTKVNSTLKASQPS